MKPLFVLLLTILFFSACNDDDPGGGGGGNTGQLYEYRVAPSTTHSAISNFNNEHFVYLDTRSTLKNKLFVFLPGTSGMPFFFILKF